MLAKIMKIFRITALPDARIIIFENFETIFVNFESPPPPFVNFETGF